MATRTLSSIAAGVDGYPEGRDAAVLAATLARATEADVMLVMVVPEHPDRPPWIGAEPVHDQAETTLAATRDAFAPGAHLAVETDASVARALERVVAREHRDLLVIGSSRHAPEGHVRIGKRTRQLIGHAGCALAVAPRGMHHHAPRAIARIGVGYDAGPESEAALALAGSLARAAGAALCVRAVVDDRGVPPIDWSPLGGLPPADQRDQYVRADVNLLSERTVEATRPVDEHAEIEVTRGRPADALLDLSASVDLIVIGSRRWGPVARLLLGSTGEALLHDGTCPILIAPRPHD